MKKAGVALLLFALFATFLGAADFWQAKPYTDWNDKELQKVMNNSPWARPFSVTMSGPTPPPVGGAGGGGGRGAAADDGAPAPISEGGGGRGGRGGGGGGGAGALVGGGTSADIVARWQSALPVKEAFVRLKYRAEAASSPEVKETLDRAEPNYVIVVSGPLRSLLRGDPEVLKKALAETSFLSSKGKGAMKPGNVQISVGARSMDVLFAFPRATPYSLDDKEVEFSTKMGDVELKYKFRLKDMVFNGKLEL